MATKEKSEQVEELSRKMSGATSLYLADFTGLDVASATQLRRSLRQASVRYEVVKNRLAKLAAAKAGMHSLEESLSGPTAMAFGQADPLAPAKILQKFIDGGGKLTIKSGFLDGELLSPEQVVHIASLPSKEELIGKFLGAVQNPLSGFSGVLSGLLRNLVGVLAAVQEERDAAQPANADA